jgi:hypothetical protein
MSGSLGASQTAVNMSAVEMPAIAVAAAEQQD